MRRTPLFDEHVKQKAKLVDFSGWEMPIHYGSQINEHKKVRSDAGMFDVSHMTVVDITGDEVRAFLRHLLANDVAKLIQPGKALYSCMCNDAGGVIDDLIVTFINEHFFRLVVNAATRDKDLEWIMRQAGSYKVTVTEQPELAIIAVQGPNARAKTEAALSSAEAAVANKLNVFSAAEIGTKFISRTGYTGEDGYEILLPDEEAQALWQALLEQGVAPIGLGARDTLRLEAGMSLYGVDMDEHVSPLEAGLGWTVAWEPEERNFIGQKALMRQRDEVPGSRFVGLLLEGRGVLRNGMALLCDGQDAGEITSGSFSPTLGRSIALARIPVDAQDSSLCVEMRGRQVPVQVVRPPFVRHGKPCFALSSTLK